MRTTTEVVTTRTSHRVRVEAAMRATESCQA